jgi:hypothetical protein
VKGWAAEDHRRGTGGNVAAGVGNRELVSGRDDDPSQLGTSRSPLTGGRLVGELTFWRVLGDDRAV